MSLRYDFDDKKTHVRIVGTGLFTMSSLIDLVDCIADDPRFHSSFAVIVDLRDAEYEAGLNDGEAFVAALKRRQNDFRGKFALVVPAHLYFLGRLYTVLATVGGIDRMRCFTVIEEALQWCGLSK